MFGSLPVFPEFSDVEVGMSRHLGPFLRALEPQISEFSFANLYLFRRAHAYRVSLLQDFLLALGRGYDGRPYAFPPLGRGNVEEAATRLCDLLSSEGAEPVLFPVSERLAAEHFAGGKWNVASDRNQADYVYLREELATLPGKKFHKRKNRLMKFIREEAQGYRYEPLGAEHIRDCLALATGWCEIRCSLDRPSTYLETEAVGEALKHSVQLGLQGGVILSGGRLSAFCLGERLNSDTFVVHFEKSEAGREGLAQLINRDFCLNALGSYRFVNREQDLGDPGLRQAKEAYHPIFLAEKFTVRPA